LFSRATFVFREFMKTTQEIESNIFKIDTWKSIFISYNSITEIQSGNSVIVSVTLPVDPTFYFKLSPKELYQRSVDKWADFALDTFSKHIQKSLRNSLKSKISIIPFDDLDEYNAFWSNSGLQFDLRVVPVSEPKKKEKKKISVYFDVDDKTLTRKVENLGVDFWENLKTFFDDDYLIKELMGLTDEIEDVSGKFMQEFFTNYIDHILYLKSADASNPRKPKLKEDGFLRPDLKRKKLFYTQDGVLGFLIKKLKKLGSKTYKTGLVLVRVSPKHLTSYDIHEYLDKYDSELNLFLDKFAEEKGIPKTKSGTLLDRVYKY